MLLNFQNHFQLLWDFVGVKFWCKIFLAQFSVLVIINETLVYFQIGRWQTAENDRWKNGLSKKTIDVSEIYQPSIFLNKWVN